jgi:hypothetical protein
MKRRRFDVGDAKDSRMDAVFNSARMPAVTGSMKWYRKPDGDSQFSPNALHNRQPPAAAIKSRA